MQITAFTSTSICCKCLSSILSGKIFKNWKVSLISTVAVYLTIKAAVLFFTGHWISSFTALLSSAFLHLLRREIQDFTNLRKATNAYQKQNSTFQLSNLQLQQKLVDLRKEVTALHVEREKFSQANQTYAANNHLLKSRVDKMDEIFSSIKKEFSESSKEARTINKKIIQEALKLSEEQKKTLQLIAKEFQDKSSDALKQLQQLTQQAAKLDARGLLALRVAKEQLEQTKTEIVCATRELTHLTSEIKRLQAIVKELEKASQTNTQTANLANAAVIRLTALIPTWLKKAVS